MNTNIIAPRLAKVVGLQTKQCFAVIKRNSGAHRSIMMGLATAVLLASVGMAPAQPRYHLPAEQFQCPPEPKSSGSFTLGSRSIRSLGNARP